MLLSPLPNPQHSWRYFQMIKLGGVNRSCNLSVLTSQTHKDRNVQFSQEGYNIIHLTYPLPEATSLADNFNDVEIMLTDRGSKSPEWGLITYGLATQDADKILPWLAVVAADLRVCVHFCPNAEDISPGLLIKDSGSRYLP